MASSHGTWFIMSGDWGGQIYLTVPAPMVASGAKTRELLAMLDGLAWACNDGDGAEIDWFCPADHGTLPNDGVPGGMGGGELRDGLWLHPEFESRRTLVCDLLGISP